MDEAQIYERLKGVVAKCLGVEESQVIPQAEFTADLGADSLDLVDLIMAIEDEFEKEMKEHELRNGIPDVEAEKLIRVSDVVGYITALEQRA